MLIFSFINFSVLCTFSEILMLNFFFFSEKIHQGSSGLLALSSCTIKLHYQVALSSCTIKLHYFFFFFFFFFFNF